jgi:hypothetical protein
MLHLPYLKVLFQSYYDRYVHSETSVGIHLEDYTVSQHRRSLQLGLCPTDLFFFFLLFPPFSENELPWPMRSP